MSFRTVAAVTRIAFANPFESMMRMRSFSRRINSRRYAGRRLEAAADSRSSWLSPAVSCSRGPRTSRTDASDVVVGDRGYYVVNALVFPEAQASPAIGFEPLDDVVIAHSISPPLLRPVPHVRGRRLRVRRTSVPETAVNEYRK